MYPGLPPGGSRMPSQRRQLVSPVEVMSALSEAAEGPAGVVFASRRWAELELVEMTCSTPGACVVAPIAFHAVSTFTGSSSYLAEEADGFTHAVRLPEGATLIRQAGGSGARYVWTAPHRAWMTCLDPELLERAAEASGGADAARPALATSSDRRDDVLAHLVSALAEEAALAPHFAQELTVQSLANAIAFRLLARHTTGARDRRPSRPGGLGAAAFGRVRAYIEENVGRHVSLDELAAVAGVSRFHFARQFRLRTGESPMGYLLRTRVERAKVMLAAGGATVGEVAAALGFADQSHLTRTFRRFVGTSPRGFTSLHRLRGVRAERAGGPGRLGDTGPPSP